MDSPPPSPELSPTLNPAEPILALALGAGGAMGLAHFGVIEELKAEGLINEEGGKLGVFKVITGASMGALAGGALANGTTEEGAEFFLRMKWGKIFDFLDVSFSFRGLIQGTAIAEEIRSHFGEILIEHLPVDYCAMAMRIPKNPVQSLLSPEGRQLYEKVPISQGALWKAIEASIRVPLLVEPVVYGEQKLGDGGFVEMVPVIEAQNRGATHVLGVDVGTGSLLHRGRKVVRDRHLKGAARHYLLSIEVPYGACRFDKAKEIIAAGRQGARREMDGIKRFFNL